MNGGDLSGYSMLDLFRIETESQVQAMTASLLALERDPRSAVHLEACMRAAHSIKGAARIVDLQPGVEIAHVMEDMLVMAQRGALLLDRPAIDLLLKGVDLLAAIGAATEGGVGDAEVEAFVSAAGAIVGAAGAPASSAMADIPPESVPMAVEQAPEPVSPDVDDVFEPRRASDAMLRLSAENLNRLLGLASESLVEARRLRPFVDRLMRVKRLSGGASAAFDTLRASLAAAGTDQTQTLIAETLERIAVRDALFLQCLEEIEAIDRRTALLSQRLYDQALACRMQPFNDGVGRLTRVVRDLAHDLGKQVRLEIEGGSTSVDRDILMLLDAPIGHLLRNAVDHGIEMPEARRAAGKPVEAVIRLEAHHLAGFLEVAVIDDGRGIDVAGLRSAVVARGLTDEETATRMAEAELMEFLFLPGFTLKDNVTDLSGRGVGLDAVQVMVRQVRGDLHVTSRPGIGTEMRLRLPLTLSVVRALLVEVGGEAYAVPLAAVVRALTLPRERIDATEGRQHFSFEGERVGLVTAHQLFDIEAPPGGDSEIALIVLGDGRAHYGVVVDRFIGERELVVQPLDERLGKVQDIESAAVLDDGSPVLIIDTADLVRSIERLTSTGRLRNVDRAAQPAARHHRKRVLVVDDSLTVRELERKLLEQHGYEVEVSVDGMDGWNAVRGGQFDLVITDVDMPRMDGIELVTLMRQDHRLASTPVMIVSYKDREEDRRRGLDAGADHYLAKSSFHDMAMLQAVVDLIGEAGA